MCTSPRWSLMPIFIPKQLEVLCNEMRGCLRGQASVRTLPGPRCYGFAKLSAGTLAPSQVLQRRQSHIMYNQVCVSLPPCFLTQSWWPFSSVSKKSNSTYQNLILRSFVHTLVHFSQWLVRLPTVQTVRVRIHIKGTNLSCRFHPRPWSLGDKESMRLCLISVVLSPSLPSNYIKKKEEYPQRGKS